MSDKSGAVIFDCNYWFFESFIEEILSGGFGNLAGLDAVCANLHALRTTLRQLNPN